MKGQKIGYIRVSSFSQNLERQLDGVEVDRVFKDKVSAKNVNRPGLIECLEYLREGDSLVVHSIDRLARNLSDLQKLVDELTGKKVCVQFVKENLTFTGDKSNPMNKLLLQMLGAVSEFERNLIRERQREGIAVARKNGKKFGRPAKLTKEQRNMIRFRANGGESKSVLATEFGVSRQTIYTVLQGGAVTNSILGYKKHLP